MFQSLKMATLFSMQYKLIKSLEIAQITYNIPTGGSCMSNKKTNSKIPSKVKNRQFLLSMHKVGVRLICTHVAV